MELGYHNQSVDVESSENFDMTELERKTMENVMSNIVDPQQQRSPVAGTDKEYGAEEGRKMLKNIIILSTAFFLLFTAAEGMWLIQKYFDVEKTTNSILHSTAISFTLGLLLCVLLLTTFTLHHLTVKQALFWSMLGHVIYTVVQIYPTAYTLIPAGFLAGFSTAILWVSKSVYITHLGQEYASLKGKNGENYIIRFFGLFFFIIQLPTVCRHLFSALLYTQSLTQNVGQNGNFCGVNFCPSTSSDMSDPKTVVYEDGAIGYILAVVCVACGLAAPCLVFLFLDPLTRYGEKKQEDGRHGILLSAFFSHFKNPQQILLMPLCFWMGMSQGFLLKDFVEGYITCPLGVDKAAVPFICHGMASTIASISVGPLVRHVLDRLFGLGHLGRVCVLRFAAIVNVILFTALFLWKPDEGHMEKIFIFIAVWGFADGIWQIEIHAVHGYLFHKRGAGAAAFSNYQFWNYLGAFCMAHISNYVCMEVKISLLISLLAIGMGCHAWLEHREKGRGGKVK